VAEKTAKKIFYWVLGVLAFSVAGLSVALSFLDWNSYRDTLSELASDQMGMKVELAGNVSVALFPRPNVSAETVRISPLSEGFSEPVATAEKISLRLGFSGILEGRVAIQGLALEGMTVALEEDSLGNWRLRGWPAGDEGSDSAVDIARLDIVNGAVSLTPFGAETRQIQNINVKLRGSLPTGPLTWDGALVYAGEAIQSSGRLKAVRGRDEVSLKSDILLAGAKLQFSGRYGSFDDFIGRVQVEGRELSGFVSSLTAILGGAQGAAIPEIPFGIDVQLEKKKGLLRAESKDIQLGSTRGRADITLAQQGTANHIAGTLALGVIDLEEWAYAKEAAASEGELQHGAAQAVSAPITGALDVTVEGIKTSTGVGQRVDAEISFLKAGPALTRFQALLPGAASLRFDGELGARNGKGTLAFEIGNLPDLLKWGGTKLPDSVPAGRLATASGKGMLDFSGGVWAVREIAALVDTTEVSGEISGEENSLLPSHVKLVLSHLSLPELAQGEGGDSAFYIPENNDLSLDLRVKSLSGFNASLGEGRFVGSLQNGVLTIDHLRLQKGRESLQLEGRLAGSGNAFSGEIGADFEAWRMPIAKYLLPALGRHLVNLRAEAVTGSLSLTGDTGRMRVNFDAVSGTEEITLNGEIGFENKDLSLVSLQGGMKHSNLAGLARSLNIADYKRLPAQLTFTVGKESRQAPMVTTLAGNLAGGKLQSEIALTGENTRVSLTFDHERVRGLERMLGSPLTALDPASGLALNILYSFTQEGDKSLQIQELRNGTRSMAGMADVGADQRVSGDFALSGLSLFTRSSPTSTDEQITADELRQILSGFAGYTGRIGLNLKDISLSGQVLNAPAAALTFGAARLELTAGEGARLNAAPLKARASIGLADTYEYELAFAADEVALTPFLEAQKIATILSAKGRSELKLKGNLAEGESVWASAVGTGSFSGSAGKLSFLNVAGLQQSMASASSGRAFLQTVGGLLRSGETPISSLEGKVSLVGGVLLVEEAKASGAWGRLGLDGQINMADRLLNIKGKLALTTPQDVPEIPVSYNGSFDAPNAQWSSRLFERFVLSTIERRVRAGLFDALEARERESGKVGESPGVAVFSRALGLLESLKKAQEQKKAEKSEGSDGR